MTTVRTPETRAAMKARAMEMRADGCTAQEISDEIGAPTSTIARWAAEGGFRVRDMAAAGTLSRPRAGPATSRIAQAVWPKRDDDAADAGPETGPETGPGGMPPGVMAFDNSTAQARAENAGVRHDIARAVALLDPAEREAAEARLDAAEAEAEKEAEAEEAGHVEAGFPRREGRPDPEAAAAEALEAAYGWAKAGDAKRAEGMIRVARGFLSLAGALASPLDGLASGEADALVKLDRMLRRLGEQELAGARARIAAAKAEGRRADEEDTLTVRLAAARAGKGLAW
ncbi:hypothetical protein FKB34_02180 [Glycocaulis profundi]|nr:hypothetical protein FKB34_02180 [Glycocaulis profundi]